MENPRQITAIQTTAIIISTSTGIGLLAMPRLVVETSGTGTPLATLLGMLLVASGVALLAVVGLRFPRKSIILYSEDIIGKWLGRLASVAVIVFFMFLTAFNARGFGEVVRTTVLENTPVDVMIISMLFLAAVSTRQDINTFSYIHLLYLPLLIVPGLIVFIFALRDVELINLLPLWGEEQGQLMRGAIEVATFFPAAFILSMIIPWMPRPERALRSGLWGIGIAGVLHVIVMVMTLAFFGEEELKLMLWPTLELAKATTFPVLERLDAAFLVGWLAVIFTTTYTTYYIVVSATGELFRFQDHRFLATFLFPFIFLFAMLPENVKQNYDALQVVGKFGIGLVVIYPLVLWIVAVIRGKGRNQHD